MPSRRRPASPMQHALELFLAAAGRHPQAALAFVGVVAFTESLAIVGTLVPAAVVMFGAGALAGHGTLSLPLVLAVAAAGAVAGDALSYELGRHQEQRVRAWGVFRRHAERIGKAEAFIARHGAASVVMARFTGAVRAFVPLLAGFARMPPWKFYLTNVASALLWAPVHILPGVVFGASLQLAEAASGRLALLAVILLALLWLASWSASLVVRRLVPLGRRLREHAFRLASTKGRAWTRPLRVLLDPDRPGAEALLGGLAVLLGAMWLFLGVLEDVVAGDPLVVADRNVFAFLRQLRTEPVDRWMVGITELGSVGVMLPLVIVVAGWLAWRRCWRTLGYWLATTASAEAVVQILKGTLGRDRPLALYHGIEQFSFPSGHATMTMVVLATLAFLLGRGQARGWRIGVGALAAVYAVLVGFSRLYLGAHWLSDVLGGFAFGLACVALSAIVYTHHDVQEQLAAKPLAALAAATLVGFGSAWVAWRTPVDLRKYVATVPVETVTADAWAGGGFRDLPARRREVAGELKEPFTMQLACGPAQLQEVLAAAGWQEAPPVSISAALLAVAPHPRLEQLPVVPKFDGGTRSALNKARPVAGSANARDVVRLWRSDRVLAGASGSTPLWYGALYRQTQWRADFGWWRETALPSTAFGDSVRGPGLQRVAPAGSEGAAQPTLWRCS
jgi:membrane protein DedA with SNARE-associated domain